MDLNGFLDALTDKDMWLETGMAAAGGAAGSAGFQLMTNNIAFLHEGDSENVPMLKQLAAGSLLAVVGGMAIGTKSEQAARGFVGGVGAHLGTMLLNRFAPKTFAESTEVAAAKAATATKIAAAAGGAQATAGLRGLRGGRGLGAVRSSRVQLAGSGLQSTRAYTGDDRPAGVGGLSRVNVSTPDEAALAAMVSIA